MDGAGGWVEIGGWMVLVGGWRQMDGAGGWVEIDELVEARKMNDEQQQWGFIRG